MSPNEQELLDLFATIMSEGQWQEIASSKRTQIYTLPIVVAMMLLQRLNERGTQQEAVHQLAAGRLDGLLADCKRVRTGKISHNTGAYARACGRTSASAVMEICNQLLAELGKRIEPQPELKFPLLL